MVAFPMDGGVIFEKNGLAVPFSKVHAEMTTQKVFQDYFALLKKTQEKANVMDKPTQIYDCDENAVASLEMCEVCILSIQS